MTDTTDQHNVRTFVENYEFRADDGDHTPTDAERALIEDAIHGYLDTTPDRLASASSASADLPADVRALVIAAREFWENEDSGTIRSHALDKALEAFSSRVPYADEPTPEPVPATNQAGEVDVTALQERIADLEGELEEALYQPWPKWAEDMKKQIRDVSGYDGYDDATDGVNLPDELSELINELTEQADKNVAEARAARKLDELERSVEHYRNGMNEWIAKAQALSTQPATSQEGGKP